MQACDHILQAVGPGTGTMTSHLHLKTAKSALLIDTLTLYLELRYQAISYRTPAWHEKKKVSDDHNYIHQKPTTWINNTNNTYIHKQQNILFEAERNEWHETSVTYDQKNTYYRLFFAQHVHKSNGTKAVFNHFFHTSKNLLKIPRSIQNI